MDDSKILPPPNSTTTETAEQPTLPRKKLSKGTLGLMVGAVLAVSLGGVWWFTRHADQPLSIETLAPPVLVETVVTRQQAIAGAETLTGTVEPVETVTITSRVIGQITSLPLQEGDRVKAGQILARIDVKDIQAQDARATAAISQAQAGVMVAISAQNQANIAQNQGLALVNQALAREQQAIAQRQEALAQLANARLQQKRMTLLSTEGAVPQVQLDEANTKVAVIETQVQQANAGIEQARRAVEQTQAAVEQTKAGVEQAKATVEQAKATVAQMRAAQQEVIANLDYGIITAPFDGVITRKPSEVGTMAGPGQPLVTLEGTKQQRFSVEVPESAIDRLRQGETVQVRIDTLDRVLIGRVTRVIPAVDPNSRSFTVKIALPATVDVMPGMFGRLSLPGGNRQGILLPRRALIRRGQLEGVYVVDADRQATLRWIKTGKPQGEQVEAISGLTAGDRVIISNLAQLSDGQPVQIRE